MIVTVPFQAQDATLAEINPLITVRTHEFALSNENAVELFEQYDLILDGADNFATRYLVNDAAILAGKPYVWGSIYRFEGQVSVFWSDAPDGRGINYRDLYPQAPPPGMVPSCAAGGVLGVLMMIPLRRALIVQQHGLLKYPEGTACAEVLKAGASEESRAAMSPDARRPTTEPSKAPLNERSTRARPRGCRTSSRNAIVCASAAAASAASKACPAPGTVTRRASSPRALAAACAATAAT